jgi:hypothetical protein
MHFHAEKVFLTPLFSKTYSNIMVLLLYYVQIDNAKTYIQLVNEMISDLINKHTHLKHIWKTHFVKCQSKKLIVLSLFNQSNTKNQES